MVSHIFCPLRTKSSPSRSALVRIPATSEPTPGLGHRERAAHLAGGHLRQQPRLLLGRAVLRDQVRHDEVGVDDAGDRHPAAGELLHHQRVGQQRLAQPAVLLGDGEPEQAHLAHAVDDVGRVLVGVLQPLRVRDDLLVDEGAHGGEDVALHLGQTGRLGESEPWQPPEAETESRYREYGRAALAGRPDPDALCEISPNRRANGARMGQKEGEPMTSEPPEPPRQYPEGGATPPESTWPEPPEPPAPPEPPIPEPPARRRCRRPYRRNPSRPRKGQRRRRAEPDPRGPTLIPPNDSPGPRRASRARTRLDRAGPARARTRLTAQGQPGQEPGWTGPPRPTSGRATDRGTTGGYTAPPTVGATPSTGGTTAYGAVRTGPGRTGPGRTDLGSTEAGHMERPRSRPAGRTPWPSSR